MIIALIKGSGKGEGRGGEGRGGEERKGKERKGKERKGKERKRKERKRKRKSRHHPHGPEIEQLKPPGKKCEKLRWVVQDDCAVGWAGVGWGGKKEIYKQIRIILILFLWCFPMYKNGRCMKACHDDSILPHKWRKDEEGEKGG